MSFERLEIEGAPESNISPIEKRVQEVRRSALLAGKDPDMAEKKFRQGLLRDGEGDAAIGSLEALLNAKDAEKMRKKEGFEKAA